MEKLGCGGMVELVQSVKYEMLMAIFLEEVYQYYGTFTRSFLTMFEIMFANWGPPCRVLVDNVSEWFSAFFLFYRCVLGFAVLNVVNAVFVQQTMKTASSDEDLAFKQKQKDMATYTKKVKKLFSTIDYSGDGSINLDAELMCKMNCTCRRWCGQSTAANHITHQKSATKKRRSKP
eukprot:g19246.t1